MTSQCRVGVLGPVEVATDRRRVALRGRQALLIALLAAEPGAVVSAGRLAEILWDHDGPIDPTNALQTLVSRVRAVAGQDIIETQGAGYRLGVSGDEVDATRFASLVERASVAEPAASVELLDAARKLWRGAAFSGCAHVPSVYAPALRLEELRLVARERMARALIDLHQYDAAAAEMEALAAEHPTREVAAACLMEAFARTGRTADALLRFSELRAALASQAGLDPSPYLVELQAAILAGDLAPQPSTPHARGAQLFEFRLGRVERAPGETVMYGEAGSGVPLLFTPGWVSRLDELVSGVDPRGWVLASLVTKMRVIAYDRYGTGRSSGELRDFSMASSVGELRRVLDAVGEDQVVVFASSGSSPVALAASAVDPRISKLVVLCGFADGPATFHNPGVTAAMVEMVESSWGMGSRVLANLLMPDRPDEESFARFQRQVATGRVAAGLLRQMYDADVTDLLPAVTQPTLVMHYTDDPAIPIDGGRRLAAALPHAQFVALDGAYHLPPARDAEAIAAAIINFVQDGG